VLPQKSTQVHSLVIHGFVVQKVELFQNINEVDLVLGQEVLFDHRAILFIEFLDPNRLCFLHLRLRDRRLFWDVNANGLGREEPVAVIPTTLLRTQEAQVAETATRSPRARPRLDSRSGSSS